MQKVGNLKKSIFKDWKRLCWGREKTVTKSSISAQLLSRLNTSFNQKLWKTKLFVHCSFNGILGNLDLEISSPMCPGWVHQYLGMVRRFRGDDPRFGDFQSDWVPLL